MVPSHKSRYHNSNSLQDFKAELLLGRPEDIEHSEDTAAQIADTKAQSVDGNCVDFQSDDDEDADIEHGYDIDETIKGRLASLPLCMQVVLHVSKSAT